MTCADSWASNRLLLASLCALVIFAACSSDADEPEDAHQGAQGDSELSDADVLAQVGSLEDALDGASSDEEEDAASSVAEGEADISPVTGLELLPTLVRVTLDGEPVGDTLVVQGGNPARWFTDSEGKVTIEVDLLVPGDHFVMASHPDARIAGENVYYNDPFFEDTGDIVIALERFDTSDNEAYVFKDPGEPGHSHVIEKCAHCHLTVADSWGESVHRVMAKNPVTHDVYEGTAMGITDEQACVERGGAWVEDAHPSTGEQRFRCKVTSGVVDQQGTGACADCHAPGIDGVVGGRDLRDATGRSYEEGAHCDVCHHVESVNLDLAPGVAGSLNIVRPSEEAPFPGVGQWHPLTFCPNPDNANKLMSCVQRDHFRESKFCGGCHELDQPSLVEGEGLDVARWPGGELPIQSTFSEWASSTYAQAVSCQGCHMPPAPEEVLNGADLQAFSGDNTGITGGWPRPYGSVRLHSWPGPRSGVDSKLPTPLSLQVAASVSGESVVASVTVTNSGAGHAVPSGEPLRSIILLVSAECDGEGLKASGGDAVWDVGGAYALKTQGEDWSTWPGAKVGQMVRVTSRSGAYHDYTGFGPFGDGTFSAEQKGLRVEHVVGEALIEAVDGESVTFEGTLPEGDVAYLVDGQAYAGAAGFAFARVAVGPEGRRHVHHHEALDIASDNRLLAGASWTSEHHFVKGCDAPVVTATLIHRALPLHLVRARGWGLRDQVMVSESATP